MRRELRIAHPHPASLGSLEEEEEQGCETSCYTAPSRSAIAPLLCQTETSEKPKTGETGINYRSRRRLVNMVKSQYFFDGWRPE